MVVGLVWPGLAFFFFLFGCKRLVECGRASVQNY